MATEKSENQAINSETLMLNGQTESGGAQSFDQDILSLTLEEVKRVMLESVLDRVDGNVSEAARQLGVTRMAMRYRMGKHNL